MKSIQQPHGSPGRHPKSLNGRTLAEFPNLLKTRFPHVCAEALESREPRNLGDISYGDERISEKWIYSAQIFPCLTNSWASPLRMRDRAQTRRSCFAGERGAFPIACSKRARICHLQLGPARQCGHVEQRSRTIEGLSRRRNSSGSIFPHSIPPEDVASGKPKQILEEAASKPARARTKDGEFARMALVSGPMWLSPRCGTPTEVCKALPRSHAT